MIHILKYLVKVLATILVCGIALISMVVGFLLWDKRFMDGEYYREWIWGNNDKN